MLPCDGGLWPVHVLTSCGLASHPRKNLHRADEIWADVSCFNPGEPLFCLCCRPLKAAVREKGLSVNQPLWQLVTRSLGFVLHPRPCVGRFLFIQYVRVSSWIERATWDTACCVRIHTHCSINIKAIYAPKHTDWVIVLFSFFVAYNFFFSNESLVVQCFYSRIANSCPGLLPWWF